MKKSSVRCKRCNKILTSPEARQRGYGELCWKIYLEENRQKNSLFPLRNKEAK